MVLFILLHTIVQRFESVDEILIKVYKSVIIEMKGTTQ